MLSFNTKNILNRIRDRIYSKQDTIGQGGDCSFLTREQVKEKSDHYNISTKKDALSASNFMLAQRQNLIQNSNATDTDYIPAYFNKMAEFGKLVPIFLLIVFSI